MNRTLQKHIYHLDFPVLQATGDHPTDEDALEMIAEADLDGDGRSKHRLISIDFFLS